MEYIRICRKYPTYYMEFGMYVKRGRDGRFKKYITFKQWVIIWTVIMFASLGFFIGALV